MSAISKKVDILAIAAHPDDVELGAGGTVIKSVNQGKKVAIVDLTRGELGSRGTAETRDEEAAKSSKVLGLSYRENLDLGDGFFQENKESLLKLITVIRKYQPEIVLANAIHDRHPDHGRGSQFISRACFLSGLLKIETQIDGEKQEKWRPKAVYHFIQDRYIQPDFVVDVTDVVDQKFEAVFSFSTQFYREGMTGPQTPISGKGFVETLKGRLADFGRSIGVRYGEGFTTERPIGIEDLNHLF